MQRLSDISVRIRSLSELQNVVGAMRSLSAVRVQQAHETLLAIRQYTLIVEDALADALPEPAPAAELDTSREELVPTAVVAFCAEHGFVGAFNDRVLARAAAHLLNPRDRLLVVGSRGVTTASEQHHAVAWSCPMASHVGGVNDVALRIAEELARGSAGRLTRVVLVYTRSSGGATWRIVVETLLPFDLGRHVPKRSDEPAPLTHLAPKVLFEKLVDELVFAELTRATTESFASESAARLQAMESARDNIEDKLGELRRLEREGRQEEITTELLDIVVGAEAMTRAG